MSQPEKNTFLVTRALSFETINSIFYAKYTRGEIVKFACYSVAKFTLREIYLLGAVKNIVSIFSLLL